MQNGKALESSFKNPERLALDSFGNVYVSDRGNNAIRKISNLVEGVISNDNHTYQEIFRGETQHTVTEGTNALNLRLSPLLDDRELTVPRITRINRPFQMVASTSDNITVEVDTVKVDGSSAVDATLSYRFGQLITIHCLWITPQVVALALLLEMSPSQAHLTQTSVQPILHLIMTAR